MYTRYRIIHLYSTKIFNFCTILYNSFIFYHQGFRGRQEARAMCWGDIIINEDSTGRYLEFTERITKTRTGENSDARTRPPRAYANTDKPERCPVELLRIYESHRPVSALNEYAPFFLSVNNMAKDLSKPRSWYKTSAIGQNAIGGFMRKMAKGAGIVGNYTNHTMRKTMVTNLLQAGVPPTLIQEISGHKDVKSLSNYGSASREQIAQMNQILHNPHQIQSRAVAIASGAYIPPVHAAVPNSNEENISPPTENIALPIANMGENERRGNLPIESSIGENNVAENGPQLMATQNTMMMDNTARIFHNATFQGCTFNISLSN